MPGVPPQHETASWKVEELERRLMGFNSPTLQLSNSDVGVADARTGTSITNVSGDPTGPTADRSGAGAAPEPPTSPAHDRGAGGRGGPPPPPAPGPPSRGRAPRGRPPGVSPAGPRGRCPGCPGACPRPRAPPARPDPAHRPGGPGGAGPPVA